MGHQGRVSSGGGTPPDGPDADPEAVARSIALARLAAAPRTRAELAQVMAKRGVPVDVAARVLDRFEEVGLVDDAAFAHAWVQSRQAGRGLARRALAGELHRRGVKPATAGAALNEIPPEAELAAARRLVDRKLRSSAGLDRVVRMRRLVGMLARRGYPSGVAMRVVSEALDADFDTQGAVVTD